MNIEPLEWETRAGKLFVSQEGELKEREVFGGGLNISSSKQRGKEIKVIPEPSQALKGINDSGVMI